MHHNREVRPSHLAGIHRELDGRVATAHVDDLHGMDRVAGEISPETAILEL